MALDTKLHLSAKELAETIMESNECSTQEKAKAIIFIGHHLHEHLKMEYLIVKDLAILWKKLKKCYGH